MTRDGSGRLSPSVGVGGELLHDPIHALQKGPLVSEDGLERAVELRLKFGVGRRLVIGLVYVADGSMDVGLVRFDFGKQLKDQGAVSAGETEFGVALLQSLVCDVPQVEGLAEFGQEAMPPWSVRRLAQQQNQLD